METDDKIIQLCSLAKRIKRNILEKKTEMQNKTKQAF